MNTEISTISHHLTDETLQDYAAGTLAESMEIVIACHLTYCPLCRHRLTIPTALGGIELQQCEPAPLQATAQQILAGAGDSADKGLPADEESADKQPDDRKFAANDVPLPLANRLPGSLDDIRWKRLTPGIKQFNLTDQSRHEGAFKLLHLSPGMVLSHHSHLDKELTLVLRGSYQDEIGRFKAGDIADLDPDVHHQPVVDTDQPCIALIATQSPVKYTGVLGRIMQPFVGI